MPGRRRTNRTGTRAPAWREQFLAELTTHGNISKACREVGISRSTAYLDRSDPEFDAAWLEAEEAGTDAIQERVRAEAAQADGDPRLAIFWLKARRSQQFGDKLREDEVRVIQAAARRATLREVQEEVAQLPPAARDIVLAALAKTAKELTA